MTPTPYHVLPLGRWPMAIIPGHIQNERSLAKSQSPEPPIMQMKQPVLMWISVAVVALASLALAPSARAAGGKVGSIDLNKILDQLDEKLFRERQLEGFLKGLEDNVNDKAKALKQGRTELDILVKGSPSYISKREEVLRMTAQVQAEAQAAKVLAEEKKKSLQVDLYEKISDATREFAKKNGYDLIVVDDSKEKIPEDASPQQAQAAMVNKRVMFAAADIDVSDQIASQMNNEFKATGMGGAAGTSGATPAPASGAAPAAKPAGAKSN
jgi:Skp family chaperone for outer membrane proteins